VLKPAGETVSAMKTTTPLTLALAIAALIVPAAAQAQPPDMHASTAIAAAQAHQQAQGKQDLRSADAADAALHPRAFGQTINALGATAADSQSIKPAPVLQAAPQWPTNPKPITAAPASQPAAGTSNDGIDWTTVLIGIAGSLLAVGALALVANRRRPPRLGTSV
jgi:hypothetical protein